MFVVIQNHVDIISNRPKRLYLDRMCVVRLYIAWTDREYFLQLFYCLIDIKH